MKLLRDLLTHGASG